MYDNLVHDNIMFAKSPVVLASLSKEHFDIIKEELKE